MTKASVPLKVRLVPSHDRALGFAHSLREWLGEVLPQVRFVTPDQVEVPSELRFAIFIAAPSSRGGKDFWIEFGRMDQALGRGGICVFQMDPEHHLGLDAMHFTSNRWSIIALCRAIAQASHLRLSDQQVEESVLAQWHNFSSMIHEHGLKEDVRDDFLRVPPLTSPRSDAAGQMLQIAIEHEREIEVMMEAATLWSLGFAPIDMPSTRYFSLDIYLGSAQSRSLVEVALSSILEESELEVVVSLPPVHGSFIQKMWVRTKRALGAKETKELLGTLEYGMRLATLEKNQAENTLMLAEAYSKIADSLSRETDAVIRLGSIEAVKRDGKLSVVSLTADQMMRLAQPTALAAVVESMVHLNESGGGADSETSVLALGPAEQADETD